MLLFNNYLLFAEATAHVVVFGCPHLCCANKDCCLSIVSGVPPQVLADKLAKVRSLNQGMQCLPGHSEVGIVIEGGALHLALAPSTQDALLELCKECRAVVCCRVTPMQKAQVRPGTEPGSGACGLCCR